LGKLWMFYLGGQFMLVIMATEFVWKIAPLCLMWA
jgi:hypothetical protein